MRGDLLDASIQLGTQIKFKPKKGYYTPLGNVSYVLVCCDGNTGMSYRQWCINTDMLDAQVPYNPGMLTGNDIYTTILSGECSV